MKKVFTILFSVIFIFAIGCKKEHVADKLHDSDTTAYPTYDEFSTNDTDNTVTQVETTDTVAKTNDSVMVENAQGEPVPAKKEDLKDKNKNFYIIVGSYRNDKNAQKRKEYFKKNGYVAEVLPKHGQYNRVSIASFNEEKASRAELKTLRKKFKDKSFWLLYR